MGNFEKFFNDALPIIKTSRIMKNEITEYINSYVAKPNAQNIIKQVLSCNDDVNEIKEKLIEETSEIINISSYYEVMSKYIVNNSLPVSTKILWQFSKINGVSSEIKKKMLIVCVNNIDFEGEKDDLLLYLKGIDKRYYELVNDGKITVVDDLDKKILEILKDKKIVSKRSDIYRIRKI